MTTVLLIRHGRTKANTDGILAGRLPGVRLDAKGRSEVRSLGERLSRVRLPLIVSSPLERTVATGEAIADAQRAYPEFALDDRLLECDYGSWSGKKLSALSKEPMWATVQAHPTAAHFPGGESLRAMQQRAVDAVRSWNAQVGDGMYAIISHGDVLKALLADALGMHLDAFQRIRVDPASLSIVQYTAHRPFVIRTNDTSTDLSALLKPGPAHVRKGDAAVGGGRG